MIPAEYRAHYARVKDQIEIRLVQFTAVPPAEYLWELCYCILTPQSRAAHAAQVIDKLRQAQFLTHPFDPTPVLRHPGHYIRFHNQKAARLLKIAADARRIISALTRPDTTPHQMRAWLVDNVKGLGWKEASHFLRNIGHSHLAIIDRHILKHMLRCGAIQNIPKTISRTQYIRLETDFTALAAEFGLGIQQLDLLFWSMEEGAVRK